LIGECAESDRLSPDVIGEMSGCGSKLFEAVGDIAEIVFDGAGVVHDGRALVGRVPGCRGSPEDRWQCCAEERRDRENGQQSYPGAVDLVD
jgi:hypothetical protein